MKLYTQHLRSFPDPRHALDEGIVDLSDDVRVERLLEAYSFGIFPWPHDDLPTLWFCPEERGVIDFKDFHVPKSLTKFMAKKPFEVTFNRAFDGVIEACARVPRPLQKGTWITPRLLKAYKDFHRAGYAHSVEVWSSGELVGGLYGVYVAGVFCGESMFFLKPNASKVALVTLVEFLKAHGLMWMDIQMVTPAMQAFGGKYISRGDFLQRVEYSKPGAQAIQFKL
ncbi:MAG: leucyl/phenylalanyl-tRNA--protein transferase [Bdellovibrionales bacterium]